MLLRIFVKNACFLSSVKLLLFRCYKLMREFVVSLRKYKIMS